MQSRARARKSTELRPRPPLRHTFLSLTWTLFRLLSHFRCLGVDDHISCPSLLRTCDPSYHSSRIATLPRLEFLNAFLSLEVLRRSAYLTVSHGRRPRPLLAYPNAYYCDYSIVNHGLRISRGEHSLPPIHRRLNRPNSIRIPSQY
jgi:hypothetical protein